MNRAIIAAIAILAVSSTTPARDKTSPPPVKSVAPVVKGGAALVYCLKGSLETESRMNQFRGPGLTIIHVLRKSGEMRVLETTGLAYYPTRRQRWSDCRLVSLLANEGYLYLAFWWAMSWDVPPQSIMNRPKNDHVLARERHGLRMGFRVMVYELKSGRRIGQRTISAEDAAKAGLPKTPPEETYKPGVLTVSKGKVSAYGSVATIEDGKLTWTDAPSTQPAEPESTPNSE